jgi:hypothetical protein
MEGGHKTYLLGPLVELRPGPGLKTKNLKQNKPVIKLYLINNLKMFQNSNIWQWFVIKLREEYVTDVSCYSIKELLSLRLYSEAPNLKIETHTIIMQVFCTI